MRLNLFAILLIGLISGCTLEVVDNPPDTPDKHISEITKTLQDGRKVTCLVFNYAATGGISCDWDNAKKH